MIMKSVSHIPLCFYVWPSNIKKNKFVFVLFDKIKIKTNQGADIWLNIDG